VSQPSINGGAQFQYLYDASGARVGKATFTGSFPLINNTCAAPGAASGFTLKNQYLLDLSGDQVTELDGGGNWVHSNAFEGGRLSATYDTQGLHFAIADPLGTKRVEVGTAGCATSYASLPYGNGLTPGTVPGYSQCNLDATEHHFTGKERDTESGNDYFGARYYASSMGRFMSPDWSAKVMPVPYAKLGDPQTLNLYAYVGNNPLSRTDPTGHYLDKCKAGDKACEKGVDEFEKQRQKDLQSKKAKVRNAAAAWGDRGQDNGVNVVFKPQADVDKDSNMALKPGEHVGGMVTPGATADHKPDIEAEFAEGFGGSDLAQTIAHEGSHVGDALNFLNSYNPATGKYNPFLNYSHFDTEAQAYSAGSLVKPYSWYPNGSFGPNGYQQRDDFINAHYVCPGCQVFDPQDYPQ
jgi:RHS repeat-associated protein